MSKVEFRLGDLLIKKGLINFAQLTEALEFQSKLSEKNYMPLGEILISFGFITKELLQNVLSEQDVLRHVSPPPPPPPPKTAGIIQTQTNKPQQAPPPPPPPPVKQQMTQPPQPVAKPVPQFTPAPVFSAQMPSSGTSASQERGRQKPIGEILIEKGYIDRSQLSKALQYQSVLPPTHYKPVGEILIELEIINREQLNEALGLQPPRPKNSLGDILKQLGIIDDSQLALVLMQQHSVGGKTVPIGELLVQHGFISKGQLEQALQEQKRRQ